MAVRAVARVNLAAIERNARMRRALARARRAAAALCAVVKADGYGHGAVPSARAALAGGATWLAVAAAGEAAELRDAGIHAPILVMGALSPAELDVALPPTPTSSPGTRRSSPPSRRAAGARCTSSSTPAWGAWARATRPPRRASPGSPLQTDGVFLAGAMTHFATADERGDEFFGRAARALRRLGAAR